MEMKSYPNSPKKIWALHYGTAKMRGEKTDTREGGYSFFIFPAQSR